MEITEQPNARASEDTGDARASLWAAAAAGPVVAAGFYTIAALRRRRSLHPTGIGYQGLLEVPAEHPGRSGVPLFQAGATHRAILRFSRGAA